MPVYVYEAFDAKGQRISGVESAKDARGLASALIAKGLQPLKIKPQRSLSGLFSFSFGSDHKRLKHEELLFFTKELADLLESGVPIERSLAIIADAADKKETKDLVNAIKREVQGGKTLSVALAAYPATFDKLYVNMVTVGEMGGVLPQVLARLDSFLEKARQVRRFIITSSIYPAILALVGLVSVGVLVGFVVPKFGQIFEDLHQPMPVITRYIVNISYVLRQGWWMMILAFLAAFMAFKAYLNTEQGRQRWDAYIIKMPFIGDSLLRSELGRFTRTLGTLLESGVPILSAISLSSEVVSNTVIRTSLQDIYKGVRQGKALSQLMKQFSVFPSLMVHLVSIGEETGEIGRMLLKIADDFEEKLQHDTKVFLSLVEPITIVLMGVVIGGVILSMLLAIFGINDVSF